MQSMRQPRCFSSGAFRPSRCLTAASHPRANVRARQGLVVQAFFGSQKAPQKMTVAITGATGLVGNRLVAKLVSEGNSVKVLTRNVSAAQSKLPYGNLEFIGSPDWEAAIKGCYGVVNLAGEPIATSGNDYLAEICREWEAAAQQAKGTRVVILRTGIVLAKEGGALAKMIPVFQLFSGGPLGSGNQWMSWVHRDDLVALIIDALKSKNYNGVYNATAPNPARMSSFCSSLGAIMGRPSWLPVPDFAIKGLLGEGATVVLEGQKVLPTRAQQAGFKFKFSNIDDAISDVMRA